MNLICMANEGQAMCDFWIVMLMIGAAAGIFRASFVFFLGPSPYGETVFGNTVMIIICILIIGFGCFILGGGFESKHKSSLSGKYYPTKKTKKELMFCPKCNKNVKVIEKRERLKRYKFCPICNHKFKSNSSLKDYKHGPDVQARLYDTSGRYERCPNCTSLVNMKIGVCRFCGHNLNEEPDEKLTTKEKHNPPEYVQCPICNHLIDVDFGICECCGFDINDEHEDEKQTEEVEHIDSDEDEKQSESVQCPICNNLIDVDFGICECCGFDIAKKTENEDESEHINCPICNNVIKVKYGICDFCGFEIKD